jgi:ABC-type dipeptide/oligopeptide/nickel transport system ATPase component
MLGSVRWRYAANVSQGAMHALDPVRRVGIQIAEAIHLHDKVTTRSDPSLAAGLASST